MTPTPASLAANVERALIVRPGDTLIVTVGAVTAEMAYDMKQHLLGLLPGLADVVVIGNAQQLAAYRPNVEEEPYVPEIDESLLA